MRRADVRVVAEQQSRQGPQPCRGRSWGFRYPWTSLKVISKRWKVNSVQEGLETKAFAEVGRRTQPFEADSRRPAAPASTTPTTQISLTAFGSSERKSQVLGSNYRGERAPSRPPPTSNLPLSSLLSTSTSAPTTPVETRTHWTSK